MAEKGKPPEDVFSGAWVFRRTAVDEAIDRAFDAMLAERMRLLEEQILNGPAEPPLGIFAGPNTRGADE
jgi:hypothetical protein